MHCENIIRSLKKWEKYTRMEETNKIFLERKSLDLIISMLSSELSSWRCFLSFCISSSCKPISSALRCRLFFEISTYILCYEAVTVRIFLSFAKYLLIFSRQVYSYRILLFFFCFFGNNSGNSQEYFLFVKITARGFVIILLNLAIVRIL